MEWPLVKFLLWGLLLFVQIHEHKACIEDERMGLLELKAFLKSKTNHTKPLLPTWVNDTKSECCSWERVKCSTSTGHVIKLTLTSINQEQTFEDNWYINISLFQPFKELRNLDLSDNKIAGWLGNKESNCLSKMSKLAHLNLSWNHFDKEILRFLGALPVLKFLNLSYNHMEGPLSSHELVNLSNLEVLILQGNGLNGSLPFKDMANFSNLKILDLSENSFTGSIPPYIGALSSLKALSLYSNKLNRTLPIREMCALKKLEELDLGGNNFEGILPPCLTNLTSLRLLDISYNRFSGNLSLSPVANWTSLEYIDLSYNLFEGLFSFSLFANHSKLKVIKLFNDNNKLDIEIENPNWDPSFQLKVLLLSNCSLNKSTGNIPKFLFDQHELEVVDISHNKLNGSFPIWLLENNTRLQMLSLRSNSFAGQFHLPSYRSMDLRWLDVSDNNLDGQLQENIGKIIPKLESLNLSRNYFEGNLPSSIGNMSNLENLDLSFNKFSGEVPMELVANCTRLDILRLSNNYFHGEIFSKNFKKYFFSLELNNNYFTGTLPVVQLKVIYLDISNNHMSGIIPVWMVNNSDAMIIDLSNNFFEGKIPCGQISTLNLSYNLLSGLLPTCLNLEHAWHLLLRGNNLIGSLPKAVLNASNLVTLDIRDNSFSGNIPKEIDRFSNLRVLLLSGNQFSGMIPKQLCWLKKISIMDLSRNFFSGTIPYCFYNISFGKQAASEFVYGDYSIGSSGFFLPYKYLLNKDRQIEGTNFHFNIPIEIEFLTKYRSNLYHGLILDMMSTLDLSFNKLTGEIPPELGRLSSIFSLNLSHNQLNGSIPKTFSDLTQLESLDLSQNNLSGEIPSVLIDLTFLAVFTVAHNNLSGKVPDMKKQFSTFGESSYEGNPFLCGPPLKKSCTVIDESPPSPQKSSEASDGKWYEVDLLAFFMSFLVSYLIFFLGVVSVLYINHHWRKRCFNLVEDRMYWCYYFALNTLKGLTSCMRH
ncbi:receptor-like protein 56 isoform X1 [Quercus lobata]|uniref:receptor-like protein 56 isoform X1 n=1 Tax=Quercus lobata TaxID=97700 RepID=UPI00124718A6|nr:receptor-like protein 56 isoform X1 [Quercus lobata]